MMILFEQRNAHTLHFCTISTCYTAYTMSLSACPDSRRLGLVEVPRAHPVLPMPRVLAAPLHTAVGSSPVHAAVAAHVRDSPAPLHQAWHLVPPMPIAQSISLSSLVTPIHTASGSSPMLLAEALAVCGCRAALELACLINAVSSPMSSTQPASS